MMKTFRKIELTAFTLMVTATLFCACRPVKNTRATATSSTSEIAPSTDSYLFTKPVSDTPEPGNDELMAIQLRFKDVTIDKLRQGHEIYTLGACVTCHGAASVHQYDADRWSLIIEDMALRASLTDEQKDAVSKYILSVKASQGK
jgi:hypothetical protein